MALLSEGKIPYPQMLESFQKSADAGSHILRKLSSLAVEENMAIRSQLLEEEYSKKALKATH